MPYLFQINFPLQPGFSGKKVLILWK